MDNKVIFMIINNAALNYKYLCTHLCLFLESDFQKLDFQIKGYELEYFCNLLSNCPSRVVGFHMVTNSCCEQDQTEICDCFQQAGNVAPHHSLSLWSYSDKGRLSDVWAREERQGSCSRTLLLLYCPEQFCSGRNLQIHSVYQKLQLTRPTYLNSLTLVLFRHTFEGISPPISSFARNKLSVIQ